MYAPSFMQHMRAFRTATGRVETGPLSKIHVSHVLRLSFNPFGNSRLGIAPNIHFSKVHRPAVAALGSGAAESNNSDATVAEEDGHDTVSDTSEHGDTDDQDDELTVEVDQHTEARLQ